MYYWDRFIIPIPIRFGCNKCGVVIRGEYNGNPNYTFHNAEIIEPYPNEPADQENQISAELPLRAEHDDPGIMLKPSTFLGSVSYFGGDNVTHFVQIALKSLRIIEHNLNNFEDLVSLYEKRSYGPLFSRVEKDFVPSPRSYSSDHHRATSHLHKILEGFLSPIFDFICPNFSQQYYENTLLPNGTSPKIAYQQINSELSPLYDISTDFALGARLIISFLKMFNQFIPSILLISKDGFLQTTGDEFYITSCDFYEIRNLFVDAFEILSRLSAFIYGLNNYDATNNVNAFSAAPKLTLKKYFLMKHGQKKDIISKNSNLSGFFQTTIDNRLRNGIGHTKTTYDAVSQQIIYFPFSEEQSISKKETIYLIDFTKQILLQVLTTLRTLHFYHVAIS